MVARTIESIVRELQELLKDINPKIVPVGSTAKGTFISGDADIDIYIITDRYLEAYDRASAYFKNGFRKYGELLIWNFPRNGYDVDLVFIPPTYEKIDTLKHTEFFNKHLTDRDRLEVIKAKAFFKSHGVYGAEIGGIVGVALEELVRRYKTLENICKVLTSHKYGELWIQDPVLAGKRKRNLLASINRRKWRLIQKACKEYLRTGTFTYKKYTLDSFIRDHEGWVIIICNRRRDKAIDYHTSLSLCERSARLVRNFEKDFSYECESFVDANHVVVAVKVEPEVLSEMREVCIPASAVDAIRKFEKKHGVRMYSKNGYKCAMVRRKIVKPREEVARNVLSLLIKRGYRNCKIIW